MDFQNLYYMVLLKSLNKSCETGRDKERMGEQELHQLMVGNLKVIFR
jgi:hypothetical protein